MSIPPQVPSVDRSDEAQARIKPLRSRLEELGGTLLWRAGSAIGLLDVECWRTDTDNYVLAIYPDGRWRVFQWLGDSSADQSEVLAKMR